MAQNIYIKRNTTAALSIRIDGVSYESLNSVRLIFRACKHKDTPVLLDREYTSTTGSFSDYSGTGFTLTAILNPEDTFKFKPGDLYVDVYPITTSGVINTGSPLRYEVIDTLCDGVIG